MDRFDDSTRDNGYDIIDKNEYEREHSFTGLTYAEEKLVRERVDKVQETLNEITDLLKEDDFLNETEMLLYRNGSIDVFLTKDPGKYVDYTAVLKVYSREPDNIKQLTITPEKPFDEVMPYQVENFDLKTLIVSTEAALGIKNTGILAKLEDFRDELKQNHSPKIQEDFRENLYKDPEIKEIFTRNKEEGLTPEVDYALSYLENIATDMVIGNFDVNDTLSIKLYNGYHLALEKTKELISVLEGAIERNCDRDGDISIINETISALDKCSDIFNGLTVDFVPEYYDFRLKFNNDFKTEDFLLGEKKSYEKIFNQMIEHNLLSTSSTVF